MKRELLLHCVECPKQKHGMQSAGDVAAELKSSSMQISPAGLMATMQSGVANVEPLALMASQL